MYYKINKGISDTESELCMQELEEQLFQRAGRLHDENT